MLENIKVLKGNRSPLGLSFTKDKANFACYSKNASNVYLGLFFGSNDLPDKEIPMNRSDDVWHVAIQGLPDEKMAYAFRCEGPFEEKKGLLFKNDQWLVDPYARKVIGKAQIDKPQDFDWQGANHPRIPLVDLVIYEMHVRGFTKHPSSHVGHPGTFLGIIEKIPYLKELGINAVELLPIFSFNDECPNINPKTKQKLINYWGYQPLHYFSSMPSYSVKDSIEEFKMLVRELHKNGIEIILDVVFNHTGEGKERKYYINFRGLDNTIYYLIDGEGNYLDFTGCGNTVNCNHPVVQGFILDTLRYWIEEMHVDGFRFDLASILTRDPTGKPLTDPPILTAMAKDPVISKVKLIAEPWDCGGLIQVGSFPKWGHWSEWSNFYRDTVRRFIKGTNSQATFFGNVLSGSTQVYSEPVHSINFVTAHDGFTLRDLVTYNQKHNDDNGDMNRDGADQNESWNCGFEGETQDKNIIELRERQMRNFFLALFFSQGIPMLLMGDEYGHTRFGNNNSYSQDNELNWFLWDELEKNKRMYTFVSALIELRKRYPILRHGHVLTEKDIEWHGPVPLQPDWSINSKFVALSFKEKVPLYLAFNANSNPIKITVPSNFQWCQVINTEQGWDVHQDMDRKLSESFEIAAYSALLARAY